MNLKSEIRNLKTQVLIPQIEPLYGAEEIRAVSDYLASGGWLTEHVRTRRFEDALAEAVGARRCVATSSGTASLVVSLIALGIGPGDEVIVPALTMIATANAVRLAGALPVLVDVDARTLCTGVEQLADSISERTRAVISVSFNGRSPDLPKLAAWCAAHNLTLIEDAAQSFGSRAFGRHLGTFGRAGCFSFSPHKIITTGQGGAVATDDEQLAERMHAVKDFGRRQPGTDVHEIIGYNFKFTDLQAVVGLAQLATLGARLARKRAMFTRFRDGLADIDEVRFVDTDLLETTPWFMDVLTENRTGLRAYLATDGIETRAFYPPVHLQPAYANDPAVLGKGRRFPVSEDVSRRGLWLPSSLKLTDEAIDRICRSIRGFYQGRG